MSFSELTAISTLCKSAVQLRCEGARVSRTQFGLEIPMSMAFRAAHNSKPTFYTKDLYHVANKYIFS